MAIRTRDQVFVNERLSIEFDDGTGAFALKVDGATLLSGTATALTMALASTFANTGLKLKDTGGDNTVTIAPAGDEAANRTALIPVLAGNKTFDFIDLAQTISAIKTFSTMFRIPTQTVAAAGSVQGDAAALIEGFNLVTGPDDAKGVRLPAAVGGQIVIVKVGDGADLKVWPATGDAINALGANNSMTVVDDVCFALVSLDATTWYTLPLLPS